MPEAFDFSGWATRNDLRCADGRTIRKNAFKGCDGMKVPLIFYHDHDNPANVVGHALLENRDEGVYTYGSFNNTEMGKLAKELVQHGDITNLSIYANKLKQNGGDVLHGIIREVSLVMAGANPGARIDVPIIEHSETGEMVEADEAYIFTDEEIIVHSDSDDADEADDSDYEDDEEDEGEEDMPKDKTVQDVFDEMTDEQKDVVYFLVGQAAGDDEDDDVEHGYYDESEDDYYEGDDYEMSHNVFEHDTPRNSLSHEDMEAIFSDARRLGSLRQAVEENMMDGGVLAHALYNDDGTEQTYGVANIDYLFPDYKSLNTPPDWIRRDNDWVKVVMDGVHHTPFSRIKSMYANITMDEARAKGYMKGNRKQEEVFSLLKRTTDPQTIYKKQKLDRDDVIDITDFDVVAWIKGEMRLMLEEECARAILVGDGRLSTDEDKISPEHIRPIWGDDDLYTIKIPVTAGVDDAATAKNIIRAMLKNRKEYKGSGNITFFTTEDWLSEMLLLEDGFGHSLYKTEQELATKLRVNRIVSSPVLENQQKGNARLVGIAVDLRDYNVGADKGGAVSMFDDFDIDYNQMKYLIETRFSGALTKPFSAMAVTVGGSKPTYTEATVTASSTPKASGWFIKEGDIYIKTTDAVPVVIGKDAEDHDIYRTYYEKA